MGVIKIVLEENLDRKFRESLGVFKKGEISKRVSELIENDLKKRAKRVKQ